MLLPKKTYDIVSIPGQIKPAKVIALKLPEDVARTIEALPSGSLRIQFDPEDPAGNV